ncbi:MAG: aldose 1-epimerase family protein [Clostridia bacterium]|nr:aldose 1-epimerase family protein [Clostridia bacterium]
MITLNNGILNVEITEIGAEIRRVLKNGEDRMWSGNPEYWSGVSPILFPICSRLPDDEYSLNGKTYKMQMHGFASDLLFDVEKADKNTATFLLKSNAETLKIFPFCFELRVKYTLSFDKILVEYFVLNKSENTMYYSIGSHESYACPEGIEAYDVVFEKEEVLKTALLEGPVFSGKYETILESGNTLSLKEDYFELDSLIFKNIKSKKVSLINRETKKTDNIWFEGFDYLLLWHPIGAPFICIEPWAGICSTKGDSKDITKKEGIIALGCKTEKVHTHIIEFK